MSAFSALSRTASASRARAVKDRRSSRSSGDGERGERIS